MIHFLDVAGGSEIKRLFWPVIIEVASGQEPGKKLLCKRGQIKTAEKKIPDSAFSNVTHKAVKLLTEPFIPPSIYVDF
jgi:hypothetical protein